MTMDYKAPRAEDISYTYDARGYMMYYKGQPIGGAGIDRTARPSRANIKLFKRSAEVTKRELVAGLGGEYMTACILAIDRAEREKNHDN